MQNRITPEMVLGAYRETGMQPASGTMGATIDGKYCGCAVGALYRQARMQGPLTPDEHAFIWASANFEEDYIRHFIAGFDDFGVSTSLGCIDGRAVRKAVFGEIS